MVTAAELKNFSIFEGFDDDELEVLCSHLSSLRLQDQEFVFHEGERGGKLFFINSGQVQIVKVSEDDGLHEEVRVLGAGDLFGEMAFLEETDRSAAARAVGPVELIELERDAFQNAPQTARLETKLVYQIALIVAHRLRQDTNAKIEVFQREREVRQRQYEFGQFFIYVLVCFAIGMLINHALYTHFPDLNLYGILFAWSYLLVLLLPGVFLVWKLNIPWARVGVTFSDWRVSVREGLIVSLVVGALFFMVVMVCQFVGVMDSKSYNYEILTRPQYFLHSYGQEFLARGLLQNSLRRFFDDKNGILSVVISSFLFALLHIHFGLVAVAITFVGSLFLGYFYLRHKSLLGVTILHCTLGVSAYVTGIL